MLGSAISSGTGAAITAFCPIEGTMYLMANSTEKPVETLKVGELIMGIDDAPQTITDIQSGFTDTIIVVTKNNFVLGCSPTHAFALPKGGFVVAAHALGKTILTVDGPSEVTFVNANGKAWVFNIVTDGSHTYRADGLWSVGVGDAEAYIGMNEWASIGRKLIERKALEEDHYGKENRVSVG